MDVTPTQVQKDLVVQKLVEDIEGNLQNAKEQSSLARKQVLTTLFQDLSNKIKKKYQSTGTSIYILVIFKDQVGYNYYFEILADYYQKSPKEAERIQDMCIDLTTNHFYPSIFSLLFYKWVLHTNSPSCFLKIHLSTKLISF